ncbi:MAG: hypothetical protein PHU77_11055 [Simplicispira sp.]|nr:hypothetical protein [Simplicispira sp.]
MTATTHNTLALVPVPGLLMLARLHNAINHLLLRAWCAAPSRWGRAKVRPGAEYTMEVAGNLPDSEVFSRPEFGNAALRRAHGFGRDALVRKAGGMATSMYSTSRHPLPRLNNGALGSESQVGAKTMTTSTVASRSAAPTTTTPDLVQLHLQACNALAQALHTLRNSECTANDLHRAIGRTLRAGAALKRMAMEVTA